MTRITLFKLVANVLLYVSFVTLPTVVYELLVDLEIIERFDRQGFAPRIGEITEEQRDMYRGVKF